MKAIETRFLGPTNFRGSRVKASDSDGNNLILGWDSALDSDQNHKEAAKALVDKMNWGRARMVMVGGRAKRGMVWVFDNSWSPRIEKDENEEWKD